MVRSFGLAFEATGFQFQLRMSSDRTKQTCLWMAIYINMYVYIYHMFLWGHIKPYPKRILRGSSFGNDNFSYLLRHLSGKRLVLLFYDFLFLLIP